MQKVVKILEKNAEWIALGIAGLWLMWVVWAYVLAPPTVEIGGGQRSAAEIDDMILDGPRAQLLTHINAGRVQESEKVEYVAKFDDRMLSEPIGTPVASLWSHSPAEALGTVGPKEGITVKNALLVVPPAVKDLLTTTGRSM